MDQEKFKIFFNCFDEAFRKLISRISDIEFIPCERIQDSADKKISVIIGVVGFDQGRIHIDMIEALRQKVI